MLQYSSGEEETMDKAFISSIHELVLDSPLGARQIAQAVGKPYSTLLREVNPYDAGAKLGAETLLKIMKITGNAAPLKLMADEMGFRLEPIASLDQKSHEA